MRPITDAMADALVGAGPLRHGWSQLHVHWSLNNKLVAGLRDRGLVHPSGRALTEQGLKVRASILRRRDRPKAIA